MKKKKRVFRAPLLEFVASENAKRLSVEAPCMTTYRASRERVSPWREKIRNQKMPSHPPSPPRILYTAMGCRVYESDEEYQERINKGNVKYLKKLNKIEKRKRDKTITENTLRNQEKRLHNLRIEESGIRIQDNAFSEALSNIDIDELPSL